MRYFILIIIGLWTVAAHGQQRGAGDSARQFVVRRIVIEGNKVTRSAIIRRELRISEGASVQAGDINALILENKLRLFNTQLFNEVEQRVDSSGNSVDWYITVKERWYIIPGFIFQFADRNFNTWWVDGDHNLRRTSEGTTITDKNFAGNLETLSATVQAGYTQKLGLNYMRPYVNHGQTNGLGFAISYAQSTQTYYASDSDKLAYVGGYTGPAIMRQVAASVSYIYRPGYAARHIFRLGYKDFSVGDTVVKLNPGYFSNGAAHARLMELFYRFEYNGADNWNYALRGFKMVTYAVLRQGFEGINFQSYVNTEAGIFRHVAGRVFADVIFRGRAMYPGDQPYYFRGGLGTQTDYVRGYEYYVIDGTNYGVVRFDLKRELFNRVYSLPVKYFTAIPLRIYPKLFADAGYIGQPDAGSDFLSNRALCSAGAGVDIVTFYDIKLRLEYAWNQLGQNGLFIHFNSE